MKYGIYNAYWTHEWSADYESSLDAAKAASVFAANGDLDEAGFYSGAWANTPIPVILVGTTSGTGSEMTRVAVLTDSRGRKHSIKHDLLSPALSFGDSRGKEIGMPMDKLRRVVIGTAIFTVAPALAIVISVISLSKKLGIPLPWMRLSVVGAITYETPAAANALSAMGLEWADIMELTATQYVTVAAVMTMGIMVGIWLVPVVGKRLISGMINLEKRDKKWGEIFSAALFLGMISAFLGYVFDSEASTLSAATLRRSERFPFRLLSFCRQQYHSQRPWEDSCCCG